MSIFFRIFLAHIFDNYLRIPVPAGTEEYVHPGYMRAEKRPQPEHSVCQANTQTVTVCKVSNAKIMYTVNPDVNAGRTDKKMKYPKIGSRICRLRI